jgi:hypothetical protein
MDGYPRRNEAKYATAEETIRNAKTSAMICCLFIENRGGYPRLQAREEADMVPSFPLFFDRPVSERERYC